MSTSPETAGIEMQALQELPVADIKPNPGNPRLHFTEEEMEKLTASIALEGILVPIVVYPDEKEGGWILIDGERRWRCATALGLERIPAVITQPTDRRQNLIQMFNIHLVREPWKDMPTAWALQQLMDETGVQDDRALSDMTGLSIERIHRYKYALELPKEFQRYIDEGSIPLNFFWELKRNVIDPLAKQRPALWEELGEDRVLQAFTEKRLGDVITDVISLRKVRPIITFAAEDAGDVNSPSVLDDTIRELVVDRDKSIQEAYEDTVEVMIEATRLERKAANLAKSFERLLRKAHTPEEEAFVREVGRRHLEALTELLG
jgi:ParB family chromosome partitioning protein